MAKSGWSQLSMSGPISKRKIENKTPRNFCSGCFLLRHALGNWAPTLLNFCSQAHLIQIITLVVAGKEGPGTSLRSFYLACESSE